MRRNALLLFSKPPIPGLVKTRLTTLKDGIYTPEVASWFYHCMLFDVVEICCDALSDLEALHGDTDAYDLIISTTPKENVEVMRKLFEDSGSWPRDLHFIFDSGASFDEHYNDSFSQMFQMGYDTVLSMGADMPALTRDPLIEGFDKLRELCEFDGGGCVISPDQEMGVSIIGWTRKTDMDHSGVFYNPQGYTVLPAYIAKFQRLGLRAYYLPAVPDVDTMADLMHNATLVQALSYCGQYDSHITVPHRTLDALKYLGLDDIRVAPNDLHDPREGIDVAEGDKTTSGV